MGSNNRLQSQLFGDLTFAPNNGATTLALNAANTWLSFSFRPTFMDSSKVINKVKIRCSAVNGTLGTNDFECHVFSDSSGNPGSSLSSTNTVTAVPTGAAFVEFTGLSQTVSRSTHYHLVFKNVNGSPSTNYPTVAIYSSNNVPFSLAGTARQSGWGKVHTTDAGSNWASSVYTSSVNVRIEYSDSTYDGFVYSALAAQTAVYGGRREGIYFVSPSNAKLSVIGIAVCTIRTGTPTGNAVCELYTGSSPVLLATTSEIPCAELYITAWTSFLFQSEQTIDPGTTLRAVIYASSADSSNYLRIYGYTIDNVAADKALTFSGGSQKAYYDGSTWSLSDTIIPCSIALILSPNGEFSAMPSGGGSIFGGMVVR